MELSVIRENVTLNNKQKAILEVLVRTIQKYEPVDSLSVNNNSLEIMCEQNDHKYIFDHDGIITAYI